MKTSATYKVISGKKMSYNVSLKWIMFSCFWQDSTRRGLAYFPVCRIRSVATWLKVNAGHCDPNMCKHATRAHTFWCQMALLKERGISGSCWTFFSYHLWKATWGCSSLLLTLSFSTDVMLAQLDSDLILSTNLMLTKSQDKKVTLHQHQ